MKPGFRDYEPYPPHDGGGGGGPSYGNYADPRGLRDRSMVGGGYGVDRPPTPPTPPSNCSDSPPPHNHSPSGKRKYRKTAVQFLDCF
jgi:hypothetical protein